MIEPKAMLSFCFLMLAAPLAITGCDAPPEADSAQQGQEIAARAVPFSDPTTGKTGTTGGLKSTTFKLSAPMRAQVSTLDSHASYGGYYAVAAKFAPADLDGVISDPSALEKFIAAVASGEASASTSTSTEGLTLESVSRGQLFASVYDHDAASTTLEDWTVADRSTFKAALAVVVRSMLTAPSAAAWHLEISDDWTDDAWVSIDPVSGEVNMIVHGGDM